MKKATLAPVIDQIHNNDVPGIELRRLENGLPMATCYIPNAAHSVSVVVGIAYGDAESIMLSRRPLAHTVEHMVYTGTRTRSYDQLEDRLRAICDMENATTYSTRTIHHTKSSRQRAPEILEILADAMKNPTFSPNRFRLEKDAMQEEYAELMADPLWICDERFKVEAYGNHPAALPTLFSRAQTEEMTRQAVIDAYRCNYTPDNMILVLTGAIDDVLLSQAQALFGTLHGRYSGTQLPIASIAQNRARIEKSRKRQNQATLQIGVKIPPISAQPNEADKPAIKIFSEILYEALVDDLRRDSGFSYSVTPYYDYNRAFGYVSFTTNVRNSRADLAVRHAENTLGKISTGAITRKTFEETREIMTRDAATMFEKTMRTAKKISKGFLLAHDPFMPVTRIKARQQVTFDDVMRVGSTYFNPDRAITILLRNSD